MFKRFFYDKINIIRRAFYYGKTKETCTSSTNDRRKRNIIHQLLEEYDIQSAEDIQDALKDLLGGTIKEMMEAEMDDHLGYENQNVLIMMTIEMAINANRSIAVMVLWKSKRRRIVNQLLSHR